MPRQTFHRWARGYDKGRPLLHVRDADEAGLPVTFIALAEAHVLDALREAAVRPQRIRPALDRLQKEFGREYVLVAPELATDGVDVLWDFAKTAAGREPIVGDNGQQVIREIVQDYMSYIAWDDVGFPRSLELRNWHPAKVLVDVRRSFGQPVFDGTNVRVADVAGMLLKAGETAETARMSSASLSATPAPPHASSWAAPPEFYSTRTWRAVRFADSSPISAIRSTLRPTSSAARLDEGLHDDDWLPLIGKRGWAVFGRDQRILERELELRALREAKVHMFLLPGEAPRSEILELLGVNLKHICARTSARQANVYWLTRAGLEAYEQRIARRARRHGSR